MPLPGNGEGFFATTRNTLNSGFLALPIILITLAGFLATTTANVGMILLFLGQILVIPTVLLLLGFLRNIPFLANILGLDSSLTYATFSKACAFSPADVKADQVPPVTSFWMANVIFFTTYVFMNGLALYNMPAETKSADPTKVENRKAHAITSMVLTLLVMISLIVVYVRHVGCETPGSITLALAVFVPLGYGWFELAKLCGLRTADLFGVSSQIFLPNPSENEFPYACINIVAQK
jgi:hypothetical protein